MPPFFYSFIEFIQEEALFLAGILASVVLSYIATRFILEKVVLQRLQKRKAFWHGKIKESHLFSRVSYIFPTIILYQSVHFYGLSDTVSERLFNCYALILGCLIVSSFLFIMHTYLAGLPVLKKRPINGYIQLLRLFLFLMTAVLVGCVLLDVSPWGVISGLGAFTALLLLIFRDTILSLIASVQISAYDMVKVGDWIEMRDFGADGEVVDVSLHTIQVQNWDKTLVMIPTHSLVEKSFKNWRGMTECGGRRIKRALLIDQQSVRHLTAEERAAFGRIGLLKNYLAAKQAEIDADNARRGVSGGDVLDARTMTNLGLLRAYTAAYLQQHPKVRADMTQLVRHLDPTPQGIPFEIYCFANTTEWAAYEGIQADIFDHLLASLHRFDLRLFQQPTGYDMRLMSHVNHSFTHSKNPPNSVPLAIENKDISLLTEEECEQILRRSGYRIDSRDGDVYIVMNVRGRERHLKGLSALQAFAYAQARL